MNVEDLIIALALSHNISINEWDKKLIFSFTDQIGRGTGFTEKQGTLALKIIKRHSAILSQTFKQNIDAFLENPTYRYPFRKINNNKRISIQPHSLYGQVVKVEFPFNEEYVKQIRSNRDKFEYAQWNAEEKAWIFALTENSLVFLCNFMTQEKFECDDLFNELSNQYQNISSDVDSFVPMLALEDKKPIFKNISKFVPELQSTELLPAIFEARQYGIYTWSDEINQIIAHSNIDDQVKRFINSEPNEEFHINCDENPISCLSDIIKHMSPCLFVIPGGSESSKIEIAYEFLKSMGIDNKNISVMFRLDSKIDKNFNNFVKENGLNNPITDETEIVFISSKLPKPVLKSNIKFNSVINLGFGGVHYSIRDYVGRHENLIFYSEKKAQREFSFVIV